MKPFDNKWAQQALSAFSFFDDSKFLMLRLFILFLCGWCGVVPAHAALHSSAPNTPAKSGDFRAYFRDPYHNPETGRFWTQDSYEGNQSDPLSLHKYTYCHNNPVNAFDPSGRATISEAMAVSALIVLDAAFISQDIVNYRKYFGFTLAQRLHVMAENEEVIRRLQAIIDSDGDITFQQEHLDAGGQLGIILPGGDDFTRLANLFESFPWNIEGYPSAVHEWFARAATGIWTATPNPNSAGSVHTVALAEQLLIRNRAFGDWLLRNL